jgi:ribosomal protein S12 methylthiotransferase accessory factor
MSVRVGGFSPHLAERVEQALIDADASADLDVVAHAVYDLAGQARTVEKALAAGRVALLVLWTHGRCWICPGTTAQTCFHCFHLWRLHDWTRGFARDPAPQCDEALSAAPLGDAWLAAVVAATATATMPGAAGDVGRARAVDLEGRTVSTHAFIRHPACPHCAPLPDNTAATAAGLLRNEEPARRGMRGAALSDMASKVLPDALDGRTGLIRAVLHRTSTPMLGMRSATLYPFRNPTVLEEGFGRSGRSVDDTTIAVLEGIERFAGMRPRGERTMVRGSYAALRAQAIDPASFVLHAPEQRQEPGFALAEYGPDTGYDWVWGYSFRRDAAVLVPLQLAYFGLGGPAQVTGGRFVYEISNGCAIGASIGEATLHGLLEVIERDAFLASWHSGRRVRAVDARGSDDPFVRAILARLGAEGLETDVYDLRCDLPPAVLAVRIRDPELRFGPAAVFAAGAHLDRDRALRAALGEAATFIHRHAPDERDDTLRRATMLLDAPSEVRSMTDHALQCWPQRALAERDFRTLPGPALPWSSLPSAMETETIQTRALLAELVQATLAVASDVIVVDQGFEPFRSRGAHCVKVLAPGLLPMTFGQQYRRLSRTRLMQVRDPADREGAWFREDPHVFP